MLRHGMPFGSPVIESVYGLNHEVVAEDFSPVFARIHPDDSRAISMKQSRNPHVLCCLGVTRTAITIR